MTPDPWILVAENRSDAAGEALRHANAYAVVRLPDGRSARPERWIEESPADRFRKGDIPMRASLPSYPCRVRAAVALALSLAAVPLARAQQAVLDTRDPAGVLRSITMDGEPLDLSNPFFQSLGTNGRSCASCHVASSGWTITPSELRTRFNKTRGLDPDLPHHRRLELSERGRLHAQGPEQGVQHAARQGTDPRRVAHPCGCRVRSRDVDDPYGYASASELSLFRRPLPATNLRFLTAVMWDGRESFAPMGTTPIKSNASPRDNALALFDDLKHQANDATLTHAQGSPLPDQVAEAIVNFELNLATAQQKLHQAGELDAGGAEGGPAFVATQPFYVTINDVLGADANGLPFDPDAMTLFSAWASPEGRSGPRSLEVPGSSARNRLPSRGLAGSMTLWACPRSRAPARRVTMLPISATTRSPCRSTSA